MRKLFSLIAAVLFAGSMMAAVTITPANCGWTTTGGAQTGTAVEGVTISVTNGMASSGQTPDQIRIYKDGTLTISATSNITKIEFTCTANGTTKYGPGCFAAQEGYTYEAEGKTGTWTGSATSVTFTASTNQVRATEIVVTLEGEGGGETPGGDTPGGDTPGGDTPGGDTPVLVMTCAEAVAAAQAGSTQKATVKGYVTEIAYAWSSGSMSFWMADTKDGGQVFEAYKCECAEADAPAVGDLVQATGNLTLYKTTAELAAGCTVVIIQKASGDTPGGDTPGGDTPGGDTPGGDTPTAEGIVITPANCGWTTTAGAQAGTAVEGVTISVTNGMASSGQTPDQIRIYKDATLTVSASSNIVSIEFTCTANGTTKYGPGCFAAQEGYTYEAEGKTGTWKGSATSVTFTASTNQVRATQIVVTLEGGEVPPVEPTMDYYVVGSMTDWKANASYKLKANPAQEGEYMADFTFAANDEFKVVYSDGSSIADENWFPTGMGNNYVINEAGDYTVYFRPAGNADWTNGYFTAIKKEAPAAPQNLGEKTIAEFLELKNTVDTCILTGVVANVVNTQYGNFDLVELGNAEVKVYVYGLLTAAGEAKKCFVEEGLAEGDTLKVKAIYTTYNNNPQVKNAIFVEVKKSSAPVVEPVNLGEKTIAEFLELKNTKDTCILTGIIANVANTQYGNFDLVELGNAEVKVYVYGLLTAAGETKKCFEEEGLAEGDTLKVKAIYTTYNNNPQVKNAIFVEVKKAGDTPAGIEITIADGTFVDYVADEGVWVVEAQNADYYISLSNDNTQITQAAGTYTAADLYAADSYILTATDSISFIGGSIVLAVDAEGEATVTGSLEGNDGKTYILNIVCPVPAIPTAESTVDVTITDGVLQADEGGFWAYGGDDAFIQLFIKSATVAGQYTEADIDMNESAIFFSETEYTDIYSATLTIVANGEGVYLLTGSILCYNNTQYNVSMILTEDVETGIEETLAAGKAAKVLRNGQVRILKADKTFDVTGARIR